MSNAYASSAVSQRINCMVRCSPATVETGVRYSVSSDLFLKYVFAVQDHKSSELYGNHQHTSGYPTLLEWWPSAYIWLPCWNSCYQHTYGYSAEMVATPWSSHSTLDFEEDRATNAPVGKFHKKIITLFAQSVAGPIYPVGMVVTNIHIAAILEW